MISRGREVLLCGTLPPLDFVFMLTRADQTVPDCLEVLDQVLDLGLSHIGFKDVGVPFETLVTLNERIVKAGATSYLEVVSTDAEACERAARLASTIGVSRLLGGTDAARMMSQLKDVAYLPFPGRPFDHPTKLGGTPEEVEADCRSFVSLGCAGCDLLAYRATEADAIALTRAARRGLGDAILLCAGGIRNTDQIRALADAGCDAFTVGSAAFSGLFAPTMGSLRSQLKAILAASA